MKARPYQSRSVKDMRKHDKNLLIAATGSGKTFMMKELIKDLKKDDGLFYSRKVLILCPTVALVDQTMLVMADFEPKKFSTSKKTLSPVTISTWQSMIKAVESMMIHELINYFDVIIIDEHHHSGDDTKLTKIIKEINSYYIYGFTATPFRHDDILGMLELCGNNQVEIPIEELYAGGYLVRPTVRFLETNKDYRDFLDKFPSSHNWKPEMKLGKLKSVIGSDESRNNLLNDSISANKRKYSLVLSYTVEQTKILHDLSDHKNKYIIHGQKTKKLKEEFFEKIKEDNEEFIIFATQSFLGEGIDIPKLDTLFLTTPYGGGAKAIQFVGRILRPFEGKSKVYVYDYVDKLSLGSHWEISRKKKYDILKAEYDYSMRQDINEFGSETIEQLKARWEKLEAFFDSDRYSTYGVKEQNVVVKRGFSLQDELESRTKEPYFCENLYRANKILEAAKAFGGRVL